MVTSNTNKERLYSLLVICQPLLIVEIDRDCIGDIDEIIQCRSNPRVVDRDCIGDIDEIIQCRSNPLFIQPVKVTSSWLMMMLL